MVGDVVITGSSIGDNAAVNLERGVVRGYDTRTGKLLWTWDPIPWANQQKVRTGAANAWSTIAADDKRGLVFVPTGSASPDYYGGERPGDNRWANSVVALKASTGEFVWGFQVVHHDLWDFDVASEPTLIEFRGKAAVAVTTKMGNVFVLDRETGKPLVTVEERAVPKSDIPGEDAAPSQPIPAWSAMVPQRLTDADAWGPTPEMRKWCQEKIASYRNDRLIHAALIQRHDLVSGQHRRRELGRRRVGPGAQYSAGQHQPRGGGGEPDSARGPAGRPPESRGDGLARRVRATNRNAVRAASRLAGVAVAECPATRHRGARWWRSI